MKIKRRRRQREVRDIFFSILVNDLLYVKQSSSATLKTLTHTREAFFPLCALVRCGGKRMP